MSSMSAACSGVIAASSVSDLQLDQCVADFQASYVPEKAKAEGCRPNTRDS